MSEIYRFVVDEWNRGASILISGNIPNTFISENCHVEFDDGLVNSIVNEDLLKSVPDYVGVVERKYRECLFGNSSNLLTLTNVYKNRNQFHTGADLIDGLLADKFVVSDHKREVFKQMCRYFKNAICKEHSFENAWITAYKKTDGGYVVSTFTEPDALKIEDESSIKSIDAYLYYLESKEYQLEWLDSMLYRYDIYLKKIVKLVD